MRKLLNTLYILSEDVYLSLDGENIVVQRNADTLGRFPLHTLENIVSFTYKGASPALLGACEKKKIAVSFFSPKGKFWTRCGGIVRGNVLLRKEQYRISDDVDQCLPFAKNMIIGKIYNGRWVLERTIRDNGLRVNIDELKTISQELKSGVKSVQEATTMETLRGIEGEMASRYFSVFDELIINQKDDFYFKNRSRRPPLDRVNALLSFAYTILGVECAGALESVGIDPYVGFMHCDRPGRQSMALDILEELRTVMADRTVVTMVNKKIIQKNDFEEQGDGAFFLTDDGRKKFFAEWQRRKREVIVHPFLKEKIEWGLIPFCQSMLLARTIRGDLDAYPPFLWK